MSFYEDSYMTTTFKRLANAEQPTRLTVIPSCTAKQATFASNSGSLCTCLSALAARAFPIFPRHTVATSSRFVFTHIRAMFSQTDSLSQNNGLIRNVQNQQSFYDVTKQQRPKTVLFNYSVIEALSCNFTEMQREIQ